MKLSIILGLSLALAGGCMADDPDVAQTEQGLTLTGTFVPLYDGISYNSTTHTVTVSGTSGDDVVTVNWYGRSGGSITTVNVTRNGYSELYNVSDVDKIVFNGGDGDDQFTNYTGIPCKADGGNGNDILTGGSGDDFLIGGYGQDRLYGQGGNDTVWGSGGSDYLYGGDGNDVIKGHGGNDVLVGGNGKDTLYGGSGNDWLYGEHGQDTIVAIGGGYDHIIGGYQWDYMWVDDTDVVTDASSNEINLGYLHTVSNFDSVSTDGGDTFQAVSKEPAGQDLPDPTPLGKPGEMLVNFAERSLFATIGPVENDILQGSVGDCYFVATLSAVAKKYPETIRNLVVDLGDGTYAVRFYRNNTPHYVRVDGDLYLSNDGTNLQYANFGVQGNIWVPIVEKAYAFFRKNKGTYASVASGNGTTYEHLNLNKDGFNVDDNNEYIEQEIIDWVADGKPYGPITDLVNQGTHDLLVYIQNQLAAGKAMTTGAYPGIGNTTPITSFYYRRGKHIYTIDRVLSFNGMPYGLVLRDPYGSYVNITDNTVLYFCIGRAVAMWP